VKRLLLAATLAFAPSLAMAEMTGNPLVMDGDTIQFGEQQVTLYGVHAPMITQSCGEADAVWSCGWDAAIYLEDVIAGAEVTCIGLTEVGENELMMGRCSANGQDLSGVMVEAGFAVPDEEFGGDYAELAVNAEAEGNGIWSGPFVDPVAYAEYGGCSCSARKKAMQDTAALLKTINEADEADAAY